MGGRVVEGARLESVYTSKAYRGFESHPIRHPNKKSPPRGAFFIGVADGVARPHAGCPLRVLFDPARKHAKKTNNLCDQAGAKRPILDFQRPPFSFPNNNFTQTRIASLRPQPIYTLVSKHNPIAKLHIMFRIPLTLAAATLLAAASHAATSIPDPIKPAQQIVRTFDGKQISGAEATALRNKIRAHAK
jgi:hypothetical protein